MVYQGIAEDFLIAKKIPAKASQLPFLSSLWNIGQGANVVQKKKETKGKRGATQRKYRRRHHMEVHRIRVIFGGGNL
jgi:hypothetical protein